MNPLQQIIAKVKRAGGARISPTKKQALFGKDYKQAASVMYAVGSPVCRTAIKEGVLADHQVIHELKRAGDTVLRIVLETEMKLGRKLPRSRVHKLMSLYFAIRDERTNDLTAARQIIDSLMAR